MGVVSGRVGHENSFPLPAELSGEEADECLTMKKKENYLCPRCEYSLVPVHAVEGSRRRVIALTCPEPYCDHMQMITREAANNLDLQEAQRAIH